MRFFSHFGQVFYKFGNQETSNIIQDISRYANVVDQIKDDLAFYEYHNILEGDRPDTLSHYYYQTPEFYWTFFLLNDHIRTRGWPLTNVDLESKIKREYPNTTIVVKTNITGKFKINSTIIANSGATGKIIHRDAGLGHIVVGGKKSFINGEIINDGKGNVTNVYSSSEEYNATHHYEDGNKEWQMPSPYGPIPAEYTQITNYQRMYNANEKLKQIKVIRPELIRSLVSQFRKSISS